MNDPFLDLPQEALSWLGVGDIGVVSVVVRWTVKVALAAAVMQSDLMISGLVAATCHTLKTGALNLWHPEEETHRTHSIDSHNCKTSHSRHFTTECLCVPHRQTVMAATILEVFPSIRIIGQFIGRTLRICTGAPVAPPWLNLRPSGRR